MIFQRIRTSNAKEFYNFVIVQRIGGGGGGGGVDPRMKHNNMADRNLHVLVNTKCFSAFTSA